MVVPEPAVEVTCERPADGAEPVAHVDKAVTGAADRRVEAGAVVVHREAQRRGADPTLAAADRSSRRRWTARGRHAPSGHPDGQLGSGRRACRRSAWPRGSRSRPPSRLPRGTGRSRRPRRSWAGWPGWPPSAGPRAGPGRAAAAGRCRGPARAARRRVSCTSLRSSSSIVSAVDGVASEQPPGQADLDGHGHQVLLGAVVQVAFDLAAGVVRGGHDAGPGGPQLLVALAQLVEGRLQGRVEPHVVQGQPERPGQLGQAPVVGVVERERRPLAARRRSGRGARPGE